MTDTYKGQSFQNVFAYGSPDRGREFDKMRDKELWIDCTIYAINTDPSPIVMAILKEISFNYGSPDKG